MAESFRTFEDLECWKAGRALRLHILAVGRHLPKDEQYRLRDQMLRASRSVTANVAEGYGRFHYLETVQFCRQARGSAYETLDHVITACDEGLCPDACLTSCRLHVERCIQLLNGHIRYLRRRKEVSGEG